MKTRRLNMAQALVTFLKNQYIERDGRENSFFTGESAFEIPYARRPRA